MKKLLLTLATVLLISGCSKEPNIILNCMGDQNDGMNLTIDSSKKELILSRQLNTFCICDFLIVALFFASTVAFVGEAHLAKTDATLLALICAQQYYLLNLIFFCPYVHLL